MDYSDVFARRKAYNWVRLGQPEQVRKAAVDATRLTIALEIAASPEVDHWPDVHLQLARELLVVFLGGAPTSGDVDAQPATYSRRNFANLRAITQEMLSGYRERGRALAVTEAEPLVIEVVRGEDGLPMLKGIAGPVTAVYQVHLAFLLASTGEQIRECADPKCKRLFVRVGKKECCRIQCSRRFYMEQRRRGEPSRRAMRNAKPPRE
jgi:hypothetical protein